MKSSNREKLHYGDGSRNSGYFQVDRGKTPSGKGAAGAFSGAKNVLYVDLSSGFMSVHIGKNSLG